MFNFNKITIDKEHYMDYIKRYADKKITKNVVEDYLECYVTNLPNGSGRQEYYDELWLFNFDVDCDEYFAPVLIQNINGSSPRAMWFSSIVEDVEDELNILNLVELSKIIKNGYRKSLIDIIQKEYIDDEKIN